MSPSSFKPIVRDGLTFRLELDRGNPNPGNLGKDFERLGLSLWPELRSRDERRTASRHAKLKALNQWRNAIAHQDFSAPQLGGKTTLRLRQVRSWRSACQGLVRSLDLVLRDHVRDLVGRAPWP